jgi:hypothetical protein
MRDARARTASSRSARLSALLLIACTALDAALKLCA